MRQNPIYFSILLLIALISVFFWFKYQKKMYDGYSLIRHEQSVKARIVDIKKIKGVSFITIKNDERFRIESSINNQYQSEYIVDHLFVGDSIAKRSYSDTIRTYSNNSRYIFIHKGKISK